MTILMHLYEGILSVLISLYMRKLGFNKQNVRKIMKYDYSQNIA